MPRPKADGAEPKKRSRTGCWPCKARKVKCGEEKPTCSNCAKVGDTCDYSIRLNWAGRSRKDKDGTPADAGGFTFVATPTSTQQVKSRGNGHGHEHVFSSQHIATAPSRPSSARPAEHSVPHPDRTSLDPRLNAAQQMLNHDFKPANDFKPSSHTPDMMPRSHPSPKSEQQTSPLTSMGEEFTWSPQQSAKRVKLSPTSAQSAPIFAIPQYMPHDSSPASTHPTPHSIGSIVHTPATPSSSIHSGSPYPSQPAVLSVHDPPDLRRLSVKSLLSDPSNDIPRPSFARSESQGYTTYGYDHGFPDLDIPHNDDANVVLPKSPDMRRPSRAVSDSGTSDSDAKQMAFEPGGYYAQPVPIRIPRHLEPLPKELFDNQMNLLYFHHFLNHTGRIMVAHDCPENPFRGVLPQMAVRNPHLLNLLLAYSASHRAKLLDHPEPANRIAEWMADVLPALRQSLDEPSSPSSHTSDPTDPSSLGPLAAAVMLTSWEIMLPMPTNIVRISWQQHLRIAREMIIAKGGLDHLAQQADGARDKAIFFLSRWFAYLDVMGSLSNRHEQPLFGAYLEDGGGLWLVNREEEEIWQIDCFFGFSGRCISLLAQVAELTAQCDNQRIDPVTNQIKAGWKPPEYVRQQAEELKGRLMESACKDAHGCMHTDPNHPHASLVSSTLAATPENNVACTSDCSEIYATNRAYHYAGIIHLSRRCLALPSTSREVQNCVDKVLDCLKQVRRGSTAESCLLFPMFTAGCEALRESDREIFWDRMTEVEGWGMSQVSRARELMRTVWDTGRGWETLVDGEFFG